MEPILELATRITSDLWYLHGLFPGKDLSAIRNAVENEEEWRAAAAPKGFSELRHLLDLVDEVDEDKIPKPDEWVWNFNPELPPAPDPGAKPSWWRHPIQFRRWRDDAQRLRKQDEPFRDIRDCWNKLQVAQNLALNGIRVRVLALPWQFVKSIPLRPKSPSGPASGVAAPAGIVTRETVYERVVAATLRLPLRPRVELARRYLHGKPFFIEEPFEKRANEVLSEFPDVPTNPAQAKQYHAADHWRTANAQGKLGELLLDPGELNDLCHDLGVPVPFTMVFRDELSEIARSRLARMHGKTYDKPPATHDEVEQTRKDAGISNASATVQRQAFRSNLFGVALSGGGIRSATFALGLLQGMADRNVLPYIDILSTVSGGGYIGSWLISWIKRTGGVNSVQENLRGNATNLYNPPECPDRCPKPEGAAADRPFGLFCRNTDPEGDHTRPVRILREYARYLAPQAGLFSADTWTILTTWARNTFLNLLILVSALGALLLLPRTVTLALLYLHGQQHPWVFLTVTSLICAAFLWLACYRIARDNLRKLGSDDQKKAYDDGEVLEKILGWIALGAIPAAALVWRSAEKSRGMWLEALIFFAIAFGGCWIFTYLGRSPAQSDKTLPPSSWVKGRMAIATVVSPLIGALLLAAVYKAASAIGSDTERGIWVVASAGTAAIVGVVSMVIVVWIGLRGRDLPDDHREWWSRLGAWLCLIMGGWLLLCAVCFFMPFWMAKLELQAAAAGIGWMTITTWGAKLAYSPKSGKDAGETPQNWLNSVILNVAPSVFALGLLSAISFGLFWLIGLTVFRPEFAGAPVSRDLCCSNLSFTMQHIEAYYWTLMYPASWVPIGLAALLAGISYSLALCIDINEFSMHNFYRNRLVRCYLGASRTRRRRAPNRFTGFDLQDDVRLCRFQTSDKSQPLDMDIECKASYAGPFPIVNTTLNVTQGLDLGLQQRKGESFIFTPLWSGFDYSRRQAMIKNVLLRQYGYRQTSEFGQPENSGAFLGTAMAISGAAFNSNAGFHTSPSLAFLLTVFGVRLGWWAGNPRGPAWTKPSPELGLFYLLKELTANTSTKSDYVLLSDGGHFENMGLYELIRRRCRYIIVSDAEEDQDFQLEGIGGAIRKCRVDFGVVIDLNLDALQPAGDPLLSRLHYAVGTIYYPGERLCGKLVYIKSSVTGDEPVDILEFRKGHKEFPNTSTTNQFFDESHFESYRALGHHIAQRVFNLDMPTAKPRTRREVRRRVAHLFRMIEQDWQLNLAAGKKKDSADDGKSKKA